MIRKLRMERWRAYEHAEIEFGEGTTFVVAANGIGKTSLLEAAKFALSGQAISGGSPVMLGEHDATVALTLDLGSDDLLVIERSVAAGQTIGEEPLVTRDGKKLSEKQLTAELRRVFDSTASFIAQNAFLCDSLRDTGVHDLRSLLTRAYQLDARRADAEQLQAAADAYEGEAKDLSRSIRSEARELGRLEGELDTAVAAEAEAQAALGAARATMQTASAARDEFTTHAAAVSRAVEWDARFDQVVAATEIEEKVPPTELAVRVLELVSSTEAVLARLQGEVAAVRARLDVVESAAEELHGAGADCPVCRRPLGDQERANAEAAHRAESDVLRGELDAIDVASTQSRLESFRALLRQVDGLGPRPDVPALEVALTDPHSEYDAALVALEQAVSTFEAAKARVEQLSSVVREAKSLEERSVLSERAWRRWALTIASATALVASIDDVLSNEVVPVQKLVEERWNGLFPDRPDLQFDLDGRQWRKVNGLELPLESFSAGEQTAARLLIQLAILTAATRVDFCWLDEPLEHLDPKTRRLVAGMLSDGRRATGLSQLVVTTYEEELAAQLAQTDESTKIEYVRAGPVAYQLD